MNYDDLTTDMLFDKLDELSRIRSYFWMHEWSKAYEVLRKRLSQEAHEQNLRVVEYFNSLDQQSY